MAGSISIQIMIMGEAGGVEMNSEDKTMVTVVSIGVGGLLFLIIAGMAHDLLKAMVECG